MFKGATNDIPLMAWMGANVTRPYYDPGTNLQARALLDAVLSRPLPTPEPEIRAALSGAVMTADEALTPAQAEWLAVLRR